MQTKATFKKIMSSILVGGMILSLGGVALANSDAATLAPAKKMFFGERGAKFNDPAKMKENLQQQISKLVSNGTITQTKADKVVAYFAKLADEKKAEFEKIKAMTTEEREAYMQKNKIEKKDLLSQLVANAVITQAEADAIAKAIPHKAGRHGWNKEAMQAPDTAKMKERMQSNLSELVSQGILTQAKADKIVEYFTKIAEERKAEFEKIKAMTAEEREAYLTKMKGERKDPFTQLIEDKIITQEEADAIAKAMPQKRLHHGGKRGFTSDNMISERAQNNTL